MSRIVANVERSLLEEIVEPICKAHGLELVDVRFGREPGGAIVRVFIDRPSADPKKTGNVTLDDCTAVSRDLSTAFDVHEPIDGPYRLEVSSPGLDRPLVKLADFERFAGCEVKLEARQPIAERRRFQGRLLGVDGTVVRFDQDGKEVRIPHEDVVKANLVIKL